MISLFRFQQSQLPQYVPLALVVLSFLGIIDAAYITYEKLSGFIPPCHAYFQCTTVLNSSWASIGSVPLSALGLAYYSVIFVLSLCAYFGIQKLPCWKFSVQNTLWGLSCIGFGFSLYLMFLMQFVLNAWCLYCILSATICMLIFILTNLWRRLT
jgi:uncharacterized membrane protein